MKLIFASVVLLALAACGSQEPAPAPSAAPSAAAPADAGPSMAPPDKAAFVEAYAAACPKAKPVSNATCESEGFGKSGFSCRFGLGDDPYPRNNAELTEKDGKWAIADPTAACAAGDTTDAADAGSAQ